MESIGPEAKIHIHRGHVFRWKLSSEFLCRWPVMEQRSETRGIGIGGTLPGNAAAPPRGASKTAEYAYQAATVVAALLILLTAAV
jgi:hypothetical protein